MGRDWQNPALWLLRKGKSMGYKDERVNFINIICNHVFRKSYLVSAF